MDCEPLPLVAKLLGLVGDAHLPEVLAKAARSNSRCALDKLTDVIDSSAFIQRRKTIRPMPLQERSVAALRSPCVQPHCKCAATCRVSRAARDA